ncbi:MAG: glycosyltransferase family 9 protein [Chthoniobacteraceae bacterium]
MSTTPAPETPSPYFKLFGREYLKTARYPLVLVLMLAVVDCFWRVLLGKTKPVPTPSFDGKSIVVTKLDHLGDLLIVSAFLQRLRENTRNVHITLVVGSWCRGLAELYQRYGLCDAVLTYDAAGCNKQMSFPKALRKQFSDFWRVRRELMKLRPAALLDLRERSPNTLLLARLSGIPFRAGFAVRGMSFTLHHPFRYQPRTPLGQMYLDALAGLGFPPYAYTRPLIALPDQPWTIPGVSPEERYLVIHPASRDIMREASPAFWKAVFAAATDAQKIVSVGGKGDRSRYEFLHAFNDPRYVNLMGETSLEQLLQLVKHASRAVVIDSFVAHIALAFEVPALLIMAPGFAIAESFPKASPYLTPIPSDATPEAITAQVHQLFAQPLSS